MVSNTLPQTEKGILGRTVDSRGGSENTHNETQKQKKKTERKHGETNGGMSKGHGASKQLPMAKARVTKATKDPHSDFLPKTTG